MPFSRSRSMESMTRSFTEPSSAWCVVNAPDCQSMESTSVVLPWSTWAMMAMLRRSVRWRMATGGVLLVEARGRPSERCREPNTRTPIIPRIRVPPQRSPRRGPRSPTICSRSADLLLPFRRAAPGWMGANRKDGSRSGRTRSRGGAVRLGGGGARTVAGDLAGVAPGGSGPRAGAAPGRGGATAGGAGLGRGGAGRRRVGAGRGEGASYFRGWPQASAKYSRSQKRKYAHAGIRSAYG